MNALTLFPNNSIVAPHIHKFNTFWQVRHLCQAAAIWHKSFWRSAQNGAARKPAPWLGLQAFSAVQKSYFCTVPCNICTNLGRGASGLCGPPAPLRPARTRKKRGALAFRPDMYPLYWTPSRGGIIMRYTYEYKRKCVELYREGKWPETPEGVSDKSFRDKVRLWVRAEDSRGPEALKHKNFNRNWTPEERLELVSQVMSGKSCVSVAIEAGIQDRLLYQWVQNYKTKGYNGLVEMKKGRPSKGVPQMKKEEARPLNESEREELIRLRAENEYIKAENEVIKKEIALREERHAAQLKARKQRSSKSCVKKDTN